MRLRQAGLIVALWLAAAGTALATARPAALAAFDARIEATKQAMMGDPLVARQSAAGAVAMAKALEGDRTVSASDAAIALATANWLLGEAMIGLNEAEQARPIIEEALGAVTRAAPRSKLNGDLLRSRATLAEMGGNVQGALQDYLAAHEIFRAAGERRSQAIALQDIGNLYLEAGDFARVRRYYSESLEAFAEDPWLNLATYNNRGQAYREQGKHAEAEAEYRLALAAARELESPLLEARILTNLADAQAEAGKTAAALSTISAAGALVQRGEGVGWRPFVLGVRAKIEAKRGALAEAGRLFALAFAGEPLDRTQMPFRELHQAAADVYERLGRDELALAHLKAFQRLDSEALRLTASTSSQLMSARFDFANQNLRIARLKQGQLERDILIERQRTEFRTNLFLGLGSALLVIFGLLSFGYVSIRRSRDQIRAANAELNQTNVELEKALRARTDFLAMTSHEIRTPLNGILGMSQVLLADRRLTKDMRERIQVLLGAGETMKTLVDDILDVAKMEAGDLKVETSEISLARLVGDVALLWKEAAASKGLSFDCIVEDVPDRVIASGDRLKQILGNLLSNAIKFTHDGGITLSVRGLGPDAGGTIEFAVRDTGIGIPAEQQASIFEPFTQVNSSTTRDFSGTGLGLAISRRLAHALGGEIEVSSVPGEGSCFTLSLPLEAVGDDRLARVEVDAAAAAERLADASVLIVDRNVANHALVRMLLAPETRAVDIASSADEAIQRLRGEHFDHVIIDAGSAGGETDGIRSLIAQAQGSGARTSLLAAAGDGAGAAQLFAAGATQLILKPIGAADLIAALKKAYDPPAAPEEHGWASGAGPKASAGR